MRCIAPSGASTLRSARSASVGIFEMVQNARAHDLIEGLAATRRRARSAVACTSRLVRLYLRLRSSVQRTLVALKSMPVTLAFGQRTACLAACDVPQPATRIVWSSLYSGARPEEVKVRAASAAVLPTQPIAVQIVDRPRIRIPLVEILDLANGDRESDPDSRSSRAFGAKRRVRAAASESACRIDASLVAR